MKKRKKVLIVIVLILAILIGLVGVNAAVENKKAKEATMHFSDDYLDGFTSISYAKAKIGYPAMNLVFDRVNKRAESTENWSKEDGTAYEDQSYGAYKQNQYNLYIPADADKNEPQGVVLCIHGGQWILGDKSSMDWLARRAAKNGYIGVTMGYSLNSVGNDGLAKATGSMPDATIDTMLDDITTCIAAVKEQCNELGYEVDGLALTGQSAGSHLSMLYAYKCADDSAIPVKSIFVATCPVSFYGNAWGYDDPTEEQASYLADVVSAAMNKTYTADDIINGNKEIDAVCPINYVSEESVPTLLAFAGQDTTVGTHQFEALEPVLKKNKVTYDVIWFENSDHTLDADPGRMKEFTDAAWQWLDKYM